MDTESRARIRMIANAEAVKNTWRDTREGSENGTGRAMSGSGAEYTGAASDGEASLLSRYGWETARTAHRFHATFPGYQPTPLVNLKELAEAAGVRGIYVKDESFRFGLNAFKALGGSFAIGSYIADRLGRDIRDLTFAEITSPEVRSKLGDLTFITATDGNHGRGVAWTAHQLGQKCVIYMPKGTARERLDNIRKLGADAGITDMVYDDCVKKAAADAEKNGWILIQDTSWPGYEEVPARIMMGYTTMGYEIVHQLEGVRPTHLFLQAGVGSMAGAMDAFFAEYYGGAGTVTREENSADAAGSAGSSAGRPVTTIVEPETADCHFLTAQAHDGKIHPVEGEMKTIMAGLCCGTPCQVSWDILEKYADYFVSMSDSVAARGMRVLGSPLGSDPRIISGESGASSFGLISEFLLNERFRELKQRLGIDENSVLLCISTEGATDRENYRRIVWDGAWPSV